MLLYFTHECTLTHYYIHCRYTIYITCTIHIHVNIHYDIHVIEKSLIKVQECLKQIISNQLNKNYEKKLV